LYCIVLYSIALHCIAIIALHCVALYYIVLYCIYYISYVLLYYNTLYNALLYVNDMIEGGAVERIWWRIVRKSSQVGIASTSEQRRQAAHRLPVPPSTQVPVPLDHRYSGHWRRLVATQPRGRPGGDRHDGPTPTVTDPLAAAVARSHRAHVAGSPGHRCAIAVAYDVAQTQHL